MTEYKKLLKEIDSTIDFKVLFIGFLFLILTSFLYFISVNIHVVFFVLCISFSMYPISELFYLFRMEEKYGIKRNYILIVLYILWTLLCFIAAVKPLYILGAGFCFSIHQTVIVFRGLSWIAFLVLLLFIGIQLFFNF